MMVRDLGSRNGTFIRGQRVETAPVPAGELLTVGGITFRAIYGEEALLAPEGKRSGDRRAGNRNRGDRRNLARFRAAHRTPQRLFPQAELGQQVSKGVSELVNWRIGVCRNLLRTHLLTYSQLAHAAVQEEISGRNSPRDRKRKPFACGNGAKMKPGQRSYIPGAGYIQIRRVDEVALERLTDDDARLDGFESAAALRQEIQQLYPRQLAAGYRAFRIRFTLLPRTCSAKCDRRSIKPKPGKHRPAIGSFKCLPGTPLRRAAIDPAQQFLLLHPH